MGYTSSISGASVTYGTGGLGGQSDGPPGANPGDGGGGSLSAGFPGQAGANGIVIISYTGPQMATGGTITTSGGNTIHTFTTSGTFTVTG
jgi:hypothetical protein